MTSLSRRALLKDVVQVGASMAGVVLVGGCGRLPNPLSPPRNGARIGVLDSGLPESHYWDVFQSELEQRGWIERQNLTIEWRFAGGSYDRLTDLANELVGLPVDLIAALDAPATLAAKRATATIPIVMTSVGDPVANGIVGNLARPGGDVTGVSSLTPQIAGKRLELFKALVPGLARMAVLGNSANPSTSLQFGQVQEAVLGLGVTVRLFEVRVAEELARVFEDASRWPADGLYALGDSLLNSAPARVMDPAIQRRWPTIGARQYVDAGALMSYSPNALDQNRRAAAYVDQILRGANPADLPIQQPTVFDLVINVATARTLGLSVSPSIAPLVTEWVQ